MLVHEAAFNAIGELANGNRLAGTKGMTRRRCTSASTPRSSGLKVSQHEFDYDLDVLADWKQPKLDITTRGKRRSLHPRHRRRSFPFGGDFGSMVNSDSGRPTSPRPVWAADVRYPAGAHHERQHERLRGRRLRGMPAGAIVIVQRGTCAVRDEDPARRPGRAPARCCSPTRATSRRSPVARCRSGSTSTASTTPSAAVTVETATALANGVQKGLTGLTARDPDRLAARHLSRPRTSSRRPETGDPNKVIVVGAHLDSVGTGSGHQRQRLRLGGAARDRQHINKMKLRNKVRFIWFSAEESGLLGSEAYVASLHDSAAEQDRGDAELRHDRVAELRALRLRRRPGQLPAGAWRPGGASRLGRDRADVPRLLRGARGSRTSRRRSTDAPTTGRSSRPGSRPAACSPAPRRSRRRRRWRSVRRHRRASRSTSVTTRAATTSST